MPTSHRLVVLLIGLLPILGYADNTTVRVFIFAGQSNMVGSDSKIEDIRRFPPFEGLEVPQADVRFSYCIGRENKSVSDGWVQLQPVNGIVGPELSFARKVTQSTQAPLAIVKIAAGGTHLGGDWNPDEPRGFKMYPLALQRVRESLKELNDSGIAFRLEGFVWHQGENDMFDETFMDNYGKNLDRFIQSWRRDLETPNLRFYIGELCTKTIWGMDLRPRMYAISVGQKQVAENDAHAVYVPTSHIGVEIGNGVGLHYHYGTLGQLQHGVNYAEAYLDSIGKRPKTERRLSTWPYAAGKKVKLFVLAGHRNMEGERAFVQTLAKLDGAAALLRPDPNVAYKYSLGGGYKTSQGWEPMGPTGYYDTFGPELSFANTLRAGGVENVAIAKFTHSGSQIVDWTPAGSIAKSRNLYSNWINFVQQSIRELRERGNDVELAGVFYHVGENDMSWSPFRKEAARRIAALIQQSRDDLKLPRLRWYVSQQPPTDHERVNDIDVTATLAAIAGADSNTFHFKAFDLPPQEKQLVLDTPGVVWLGRQLAQRYLNTP